MMDTLRQGHSLVVFPEGTRHRGPGLMPFRPGAFRAAVDIGRPIVPITITGTAAIWPSDGWALRRGDVDVVIHDAIHPDDQSRKTLVRLRDAARLAIASGFDR